jgi:C1A family cysteine protease
MEKLSARRALAFTSAILLFVMLSSSFIAGLSSPVLAQSDHLINTTEIPHQQVEATPTLEEIDLFEIPNEEEIPAESLDSELNEKVELDLENSLLVWSLEMDLTVPNEQIQAMGGSVQASRQLLSTLNNLTNNNDIQIHIVSSTPSSDSMEYTIGLAGSSQQDDLRHLLFTRLGTDFDFIGEPVELFVSGTVTVDQLITLVLETRPATGYQWTIAEYDPNLISIEDEPTYESKAHMPGAPALETLSLRAIADGETSLRLMYQRPFGPGETTKRRLSLQSDQFPKKLELSDSLAENTFHPSDLRESDEILQSQQEELAAAALPSSFDWRSFGKVTPIRDQGACGSCWAFGTAGVMESALLIQNNVNVNISEQYLVSCNNSGYSCKGGWWAHNLHSSSSGKNSNPPGAVMESDFPYSATNGTCSKIYNHPYRLAKWNYVGAYGIPSVDALKAAIYNYGPIAVGVCSAGFSSYTGGVYTQNNKCVDHIVILVGWNDADQTWILRNSWGTYWGESGYMRIRWGVSNVGYEATYVVAHKTPSNDDFNNAVAIANPGGKISFKQTISTSGATRASDDPTFPFKAGPTAGEKSVWYRFTTVTGGQLIVNTSNSKYDTVMGVWTGSRGSLTNTKWNDNASSTVKTSRISFSASPNTTYYINVVSKRDAAANLTFNLQFTPPTARNNSISYAVKIPNTTPYTDYTELRDIWNATTVSTDPKFPLATGNTAGYRTVWYTIKPTASGLLTVGTQGSNFDTMVGIFRNSKMYIWDDDSGGNGTSYLQIKLAAHVTYRIMVSSKTKIPESRLKLNVKYLPNAPVGPGTYDNTHSAIAYVGSWNNTGVTGAYGGTIHQASASSSIANLTFTGTGIDYFYASQPGGGNVDIYINGVRKTNISQKSELVRVQRKWSSAKLTYGTHNITIISTNGGKVNVDDFVVRP